MSELTRRIRRKLDAYKPKTAIQPARMGLDDGTVEVDGEKYMIWVKLFDGQTVKVLNQRVTNKFGKLIQVGYDEVQFPSRLQVLGTWDVYMEAQWAGAPNHAEQHGWLGDDPLYLRQEQFAPGLVLPVGADLKVDVYPFSCFSGGSWYTQSEIERVDVSAGVPSSAGYRYGLLVLTSAHTFAVRVGSVVLSRMELTLDMIPAPESGDTPLAGLVLYFGQLELVKEDQNNDIVDLRFLGVFSVIPDLSVYVKKDGSEAFTGAVGGVNPTSAEHLATKNYVDTLAALTVQEIDGAPSVSGVTEIRVTNGTMTDVGGGVVELDFGSSATDGSAIHDNVGGEISLIAEKTSLVDDDLLVIEDSADTFAKKRAKVSAFGGSAFSLVVNENFADLAAWTQVRGSWSVAGNVLSKTNTGFADLRWNTDYYTITNGVLEVEIRFPTDPSVSTHAGLVSCWDGSTLTGQMYARILRNSSSSSWVCQMEKAALASWASIDISTAFAANTWYTLRVDFSGLMFPVWINGSRLMTANPLTSSVTQAPKYVGLRVGDTSGVAVDFRNFKVWVKNNYP